MIKNNSIIHFSLIYYEVYLSISYIVFTFILSEYLYMYYCALLFHLHVIHTTNASIRFTCTCKKILQMSDTLMLYMLYSKFFKSSLYSSHARKTKILHIHIKIFQILLYLLNKNLEFTITFIYVYLFFIFQEDISENSSKSICLVSLL